MFFSFSSQLVMVAWICFRFDHCTLVIFFLLALLFSDCYLMLGLEDEFGNFSRNLCLALKVNCAWISFFYLNCWEFYWYDGGRSWPWIHILHAAHSWWIQLSNWMTCCGFSFKMRWRFWSHWMKVRCYCLLDYYFLSTLCGDAISCWQVDFASSFL